MTTTHDQIASTITSLEADLKSLQAIGRKWSALYDHAADGSHAKQLAIEGLAANEPLRLQAERALSEAVDQLLALKIRGEGQMMVDQQRIEAFIAALLAYDGVTAKVIQSAVLSVEALKPGDRWTALAAGRYPPPMVSAFCDAQARRLLGT